LRGEQPGAGAQAPEGAPQDGDEGQEGGPEDDGLGEQPTVGEAAFSDRGENGRGGDKQAGRRRRRGRRGGRRGRDRNQETGELATDSFEGNDDSEAAESGGDGNGAEASVPVRNPNSSRKPDRPGEVRAADNDQDAAEAAGGVQRSRRIWDVPSVANGVDGNAPAAAPPAKAKIESSKLREPAAETKAAATPARRRHETGSSEPRIERVVVKPGDESEGSISDVQAAPQRKGWWQRKFGGE
jgi:ribonuclease E